MADDGRRDAEPVTEGGEYKIGAVLEKARQEKGLTLQEVEEATKIRKRYLDGLEREDYNVLPDVVYAQGFLKTYANFLDLDGDELSAELKRRRGRRRDQRGGKRADQRAIRTNSSERDFIKPGGVSGARRKLVTPSTFLTVVLAIVAIAVVIGVLYYVGRDTQASADLQPASSTSSAPAGESEPTPKTRQEPNPGAAKAEEEFTVRLASEGETWLSVETDGRTGFARVVDADFEQTFEARRRVSINAGNAGVVTVEVNGQDLGPLGPDGETLVSDFSLKDAS